MTNRFNNKYRIPTNRLKGYDYGADGWYFVTICTKNRLHYFGEIVETHHCASLQPTATGIIANEYWIQIPQHYPFARLDAFVVMPDHIHGILFFDKPNKKDWKPNEFGPQSQNLAAIIRAFKSSVKRHTNQNNVEFAWQARFHDRIIRSQQELDGVRNYIAQNPEQWIAGKQNK